MTSNAPADILVCYDITEPSRLQRVHRHLRRWALPLQYSVFYCRLTRRQRRRLEYELRSLIDERTDDVRLYCIQAAQGIQFWGVRPLTKGAYILPFPKAGQSEAS